MTVRTETEVIRGRGPWRSVADPEFSTLAWVAWFNTQRLTELMGNAAPAELEEQYHRAQATQTECLSVKQPCPLETEGSSGAG